MIRTMDSYLDFLDISWEPIPDLLKLSRFIYMDIMQRNVNRMCRLHQNWRAYSNIVLDEWLKLDEQQITQILHGSSNTDV